MSSRNPFNLVIAAGLDAMREIPNGGNFVFFNLASGPFEFQFDDGPREEGRSSMEVSDAGWSLIKIWNRSATEKLTVTGWVCDGATVRLLEVRSPAVNLRPFTVQLAQNDTLELPGIAADNDATYQDYGILAGRIRSHAVVYNFDNNNLQVNIERKNPVSGLWVNCGAVQGNDSDTIEGSSLVRLKNPNGAAITVASREFFFV